MPVPSSDKPDIAVFHNMARSGGTMVSKCIGALSGVRLFSEIHPRANHVEYLNVTDQAARWYGLVDAEREDVRLPFMQGIQKVHSACLAEGTKMVLRDWATIDFIGKVLVEDPVNRFSLDEALASDFNVQACALVRHPLDQWLSTRRLKIYANKLTLDEFLAGYRRYAETIGSRFVRYEDFTRDPMGQMGKICAWLGIAFDPTFINRWHQNTFITGDNKHSSRGSQHATAHVIRPLPRRQVDPELAAQLMASDDYQAAIFKLGYQTSRQGSV